MKITAIREKSVLLSSDLRNAYSDFSKMTASAVAVITDVVRDGRPVIGYGFNSNGRYAAGGLMRERFIPKIMNADPTELRDHTGENLFSMQDARNLIRYSGMRADRNILQFDCALSYGLVEYLHTLEMLKAHGWSARRCVPHRGHQMSLNIAAGLGLGGNESYPGVFQPFGGFADHISVEEGYVLLQDTPGIGIEEKATLNAVLRSLHD